MKIISIEPTPNPNSMKINMDESLPDGVKISYTKENQEKAPDYIKKLLAIHGLKGVFQVADFIALERNPKVDWQTILSDARHVFEQQTSDETDLNPKSDEVHVYVQMIKELPMQVKLLSGTEDVRVALPGRFKQAAMQGASVSADFLAERKWIDLGTHYGDIHQIGAETADRIAVDYDEERLNQLVALALKNESEATETLPVSESVSVLNHPDWKKRYAALEQINASTATMPLFIKALEDPQPSIRRLATVNLGMIDDPDVLPYLYEALRDKTVSVRRAAGDALSDLGKPDAIGPMSEALKDPSKLVRWRAARFLYEVGDASVIPALLAAQDDSEFEVRLQIKLALERIEGGKAASGPVWQQMTKHLNDKIDE